MVENFYSNNYIQYESNCNINKTLSIKEHLDEIQLTIAINFMSSTDTDEEHKYTVIHSKSDNIDIVINDKAGEVIEELFESYFLDMK